MCFEPRFDSRVDPRFDPVDEDLAPNLERLV
jgi:hypothetical protein